MTKITHSKFIIFILGLILLTPIALAASFGISPPWIINENLKPGTDIQYRFNLSTSDSSEGLIVSSKISGDPEIAKWITIRDQDKLMIPKGKKYVYMYADLKIPKNAKLKKYKGVISIKASPKKRSKKNVAVNLGGSIRVQLGVVNTDITDYKIKSVVINPMSEKTDKLDLKLKIQNAGNTYISNIQTNIQIRNDESEKIVATSTASKLLKTLNPHKTTEVKLPMALGNKLDFGRYWADVEVLKDDKSFYKSKVYFTINSSKVSSMQTKGDIKTSVRVKDTMENILVGTITLIFSLIVVDVRLRLRKRRNNLTKY